MWKRQALIQSIKKEPPQRDKHLYSYTLRQHNPLPKLSLCCVITMYSYLWGGGTLFFFSTSNCLEKMEQYKYKYYTYSHYHSKLLKPERFLVV